ncbi:MULTISPECIES: ATP-binding protein [unclassified Polaromonas]|uniref:sensor histidine kinase n=1 Tax=unclassified Polaromonas TaxID=2638319 RepID=UPI0018C94790|nr:MULTISPECIES: PAS domain-containing sensor histidine kinase [unclassified Polaromonas]MBG6072955.1 PAS domain S-box-containing protein [Polaromonas sp. CG_9.7]MBG6114895.1 PAS domain S-box-containing protein [Polaromonas sp. CG_9.2]
MTRFLDNSQSNPPDNVPADNPHDVNAIVPPARHEWGVGDLTLDGIVLLDQKLVIVDANPRALVFLHTSLSAISGYSLWDVVSQEIASQHEEAAERALADSDQYVFVIHESHTNSWAEYTLRRCAAGYIVNLREAGPAQKYQRLLEDSKRYNQLIFEANPNAMWVFDRTSLQIFAVNQAAIRFYGIARKTFTTLGMNALFPEGEGAELLDSMHVGKEGQSEMRLCRQKRMDGKEVLVELAWSQVKWNGSQAMLVSLADTSDRHIADTALKKSNAELQQTLLVQQAELKNARHDLLTFTQAVSTDLQDSLHVAQGFAARLAEKYSPVLDDQGLHYVKRIQSSISQLARLVDDLRTLAQLPLRSGTLEMVDLAPVCRSLFADLRKLNPDRNVTIEMDSSLTVVGNRGLLVTALHCLLDNAWKFSDKKSEAWIKVGLLPGKQADELTLVVADNGAGFDPVYSGNLFTAFQRLHSSADFPGNGLGLAIIKRVAQLHGGTAWAESPDHMGASFFMSLPQMQPVVS